MGKRGSSAGKGEGRWHLQALLQGQASAKPFLCRFYLILMTGLCANSVLPSAQRELLPKIRIQAAAEVVLRSPWPPGLVPSSTPLYSLLTLRPRTVTWYPKLAWGLRGRAPSSSLFPAAHGLPPQQSWLLPEVLRPSTPPHAAPGSCPQQPSSLTVWAEPGAVFIPVACHQQDKLCHMPVHHRPHLPNAVQF